MSGACFSPDSAGVARPSSAGGQDVSRVSVLRSAAELARLIPQWESLAAEALEPNPFHEHWIMLPALEAFGGAGFLCAAVWSGGRLDAMFPLERGRRFKGIPLRTLTSWRHRHSMLCTPLIRKGRAAESLAALFRWLRSAEGASLLQLEYLAADGPVQLALIDALNAAELQGIAPESYTRALMVADRDAESYMRAALSESFRRKMARNERRLQECGAVAHRVSREHGELERWIDEFLRLEASGWKGRQGGALACSEPNVRFARQVFRSAFERGRLLMLGIDLDGKPIARMCGFAAGEGSFAFKSAYDEAFGGYAPGILIELDWIRRIHETPEIRWSDSYTAPGNEMIRRLWKGGRAIQRFVIGADLRGELAVASLPLARFLKKIISALTTGESGNRDSTQPRTAIGEPRGWRLDWTRK
jgi:CelD/BcsL family acetyltransferase involved in cellulose biosynthesis